MAFRDFTQRRFLPYAILPVLVTVTAFILCFLCLFAGHKPGYMEEYSVFTLNTSRVGENLLLDLDNKILSLNLSTIFKRSEEPQPVLIAMPTITAPPTTLITMAPRDLSSILAGAQSDVSELASEVGSKATAVKSGLASQASELASAAESKVNSAIGAAATSIVEAVNEAYYNLIEEFELKDFYSVHMMTTCSGAYAYPNGTNITVGESPIPPPSNVTLHKDVVECDGHGFLDPVQIVRIMYEIGIAFTGIALLLGIWGTVSFSKKAALINILGTLPAVLLVGLASAAVHGVAVGAAELINFVGGDIGISGQAGRKFIALSWAATILLIVNVGLWTILLFLGERLPALRRKRDAGEKAGHEMQIGQPQPQYGGY